MNQVYQIVTNKIIEQLEKGAVPWQRPWSITGEQMAYNCITKKPYSLLNQMLLSHTGKYASAKQWQTLGFSLKNSAIVEIVVFWKMLPVRAGSGLRADRNSSRITNAGESSNPLDNSKDNRGSKMIPLLRYHRVYHVSQIAGAEHLEDHEEHEDETGEPEDPIELSTVDFAEQIIRKYQARESLSIDVMRTNKACYCASTDRIVVPELTQYNDIAEYYSTLFHEIVHSSGSEKRLKRPSICGVDRRERSKAYALEELIAEIGSAILVSTANLDNEKAFQNSAAYIDLWRRKLSDDPKLIVSASGKAEKAVRWILGESEETNEF